jgi:uncharacterized membrane protein YbhN (UPF0104 family)
VKDLLARIAARRWLVVTLQSAAALALIGALVWFVRGRWDEAGDRIANASWLDLTFALLWLAAYYLFFVVGWIGILRAWGIRLAYRDALQAEMVSMLAKYIPGGVWTPAARVLAVRRAGITDTTLVLSSILIEAGLSAVSGVLVFLAGVAIVGSSGTDLAPVLAFGLLLTVLLHPRVFNWLARFVFKPFGGRIPPPLPWRTMLALLVYYAFTWVIGGAALFFLVRSVGGIVAVVVVFAPSGVGVREGAMYKLIEVIAPSGAALGTVVLNRVAITVVEAALLVGGLLVFRLLPGERSLRPVER